MSSPCFRSRTLSYPSHWKWLTCASGLERPMRLGFRKLSG